MAHLKNLLIKCTYNELNTRGEFALKHKKFILYSVCIIFICSFIGIKLYTDKNKGNKKSVVANNTKQNKTNIEANNIKSTEDLNTMVSSSGTVSSYTEMSKPDITMKALPPILRVTAQGT